MERKEWAPGDLLGPIEAALIGYDELVMAQYGDDDDLGDRLRAEIDEARTALEQLRTIADPASSPLDDYADRPIVTRDGRRGEVIAIDNAKDLKPLIVRHDDGSIGYYHTDQVRFAAADR